MAAFPAVAADTRAPKLVAAQTIDSNANGKVDRVRLTYNERVRHTLDRSHFPFSVSRHRIKQASRATAKTIILLLEERSASDLISTPAVEYVRTANQPVRDLAGNQAAEQTFRDTCGLADEPDPKLRDSDCDGIDGNPVGPVFVSPNGDDANLGTKDSPLKTLHAALDAAETASAPIYVAAGTYFTGAGIALFDDARIYGGYAPDTWARAYANLVTIEGSPQAALADGDTGVVLQLLRLEGSIPPVGERSAYGIRAINGSEISLRRVTVKAGGGKTGSGAGFGTPGTAGADGADAIDQAGAAAGMGPGGSGGNGGNGGLGLDAGAAGAPGQPALSGGAGGPNGEYHLSGSPGLAPLPGAAGAPGSNGVFTLALAGATWTTQAATNGAVGADGPGGGGGGGGGGYRECDIGPTCVDFAGGGGGGGGAGGGGGGGGYAGVAGGGSFGIYLYDSSLTVDAASSITSAGGGPGSDGGAGGPGGSGGDPGRGFAGDGGSGSGGDGGAGGAGGDGGPGGGGAGGPSIGIFIGGADGSANYPSSLSITIASGGLGGRLGGIGGHADSGVSKAVVQQIH